MTPNRPADFAQSGAPPDGFSSRGHGGHTIGFRRDPNGYRNGHTIASAPVTSATPPPSAHQTLPKRPKGQLLIGTVFCCCLVASAYFVWNALFRYEGYGVVNGRVLAISPAWEGIVTSMHVRSGELVRQGQPLFTMVNDDLEQQMRQFEDELRTATAGLEAELYELHWESETRDKGHHTTAAEYHKRRSELEAERTQCELFKADLHRLRTLQKTNARAVKAAELEALEISQAGQENRVEALSKSVLELEVSATSQLDHERGALCKFQSRRTQIEGLETNIERLREQFTKGLVRSPVEGRVVKKYLFTGEFAKTGEPVLDILEDGSLQVSLFLPQVAARRVSPGQNLTAQLDATGAKVFCRVKRLGERFAAAPPSVQRYYHKDEPVLTVDAELPLHVRAGQSLPLGSIVRLPRQRGLPFLGRSPGQLNTTARASFDEHQN